MNYIITPQYIQTDTDCYLPQAELSRLQTTHDTLLSTNKSAELKMERLTLELKAVKAHEDELGQQVLGWQRLGDKEGKETEALRKAKVDLELRVRALEGQVENQEKAAKVLKKEREKNEKLSEEVAKLEVWKPGWSYAISTNSTWFFSSQELLKAAEAQKARAEAAAKEAQAKAARVRSDAAAKVPEPAAGPSHIKKTASKAVEPKVSRNRSRAFHASERARYPATKA